MGLIKKQLTFLFYGFVFWLPVLLVVYIGMFIYSNADKIGRSMLDLAGDDTYLFSGIGLLLCLVIVYLSGILLKLTNVGKVLSRIPFIGIFFGQGEIMTIGRLSHMQPCLFLYSPTCISYGWILSEEKINIKNVKAQFAMINVYFANVPTLVTGQVFAVRKSSVMKLGNTSSDVINLLLYTFRSPAALEYLPWEDETQEEFEERSQQFGLNRPTISPPRN
ncbi:MAG: hypothetical protein WC370_07355 [Dehalococcoidales bacterium]|jgi:uncharacterized membrane protein